MITSSRLEGMLKCDLLKHLHMRMLVLAMLLSAMFAPSVLADVKWEEDGWLATIAKHVSGSQPQSRRHVAPY